MHAPNHVDDCIRIASAVEAASYCESSACARCHVDLVENVFPNIITCDACSAVVWCGSMCAAADRHTHEEHCVSLSAGKFESMLFAASSGHEDAAYNIGVVYESGMFGIVPDEREAARWFGAAAEAGSPRAAFQLGIFYKTGRVFPIDDRESFAWFCIAAEGGHVLARFNAGVQLEKGLGVGKDVLTAAECFAAVVKQSEEDGDIALGRIARRRYEACRISSLG
jgi:TPR repeat protein